MFSGYRTYIAAAGLVGLGLYQLSQGQLDAAVQSFAQALGLFGLRAAVGRVRL